MKFKFDKKSIITLIVALAVIVVGVVLDQLTKIAFQNLAQKGELPITVIPGVFNFTYALNTGAAWGSFEGNNVMFFVLTAIALPVFFIIMLSRLKRGFLGTLGFAMIVSGAVGNAIDRAFLGDGFYNGAVRDFLETRFLGPINFVCNVADIFLTVGVVLVMVAMFFTDDDAIFKQADKRAETIGQQKSSNFTMDIDCDADILEAEEMVNLSSDGYSIGDDSGESLE